MYNHTKDKAPESYLLAPVSTSSISGTPRSSSSQDGASPSTFDINSSRVGDLDDPFSDARERFAHLALTPTQQNNIFGSNSERARELKALSSSKDVREGMLKAMEEWGKSFESTEQELLFEDMEPLGALKKKTNSDLIQKQFEAVVKYGAGIKAFYEGFQALRKSFDDLASAEHMTVDQQVEAVIKLGEELGKHATVLGKNANIILDSRSDIWKFQESSVKETQNQIDSILRAEYDHQEKIQFVLDMLKDGERMTPKIKEPSGLASALLEGAGKYGLLKLGKRYKNKGLGSKMLQTTYQEEKSKTNALYRKLDESRGHVYAARTALRSWEKQIYTDVLIVIDRVKLDNTKVSYVAIANKLDVAEGKLLTFIELLEEFLARIAEEYGIKFGSREGKRLCSRVPNIFVALEMLLSAKEVIVDDHQYIYEEHIYELCKAISEHFNVMEEVHWECVNVVSVERQAAFLRDDVPKFRNSITPHLQAIKDIAETHISKPKSKEASDKRAKEDRFRGDSALTRPGRPLVTGDEIIWALHKVIDALLLIQAISRASTASDQDAGENANCAETAANDPLVWFKMPKEMMDQIHAVLFDEAKKLKFLKDQRPTNARSNSNEEPGGHFTRLRRLMGRKPR